MYNFRTDMADERLDIHRAAHDLDNDISGIITNQKVINKHIKLNTIEVNSKEAEEAIGKAIGKYITFDLKDLKYADEKEIEESAKIISEELKIMIDDKLMNNNTDKQLKDKSVLVVGLGNQYVTPDALGPKVISEIEITRHLKKYAPKYVVDGAKTISAIAPGVLGTTGIETYEIVKGVTENIKPDLIIAIDSLFSKSIKRISCSVQIGNTGIVPGSGVENKRAELSISTLGIPVIAIGVPMCVDVATITDECLNVLIGKLQDEAKSDDFLNKVKQESNYEKIRSALIPDDYNMIVTPKEIDDLVENMKCIVARSINYAL